MITVWKKPIKPMLDDLESKHLRYFSYTPFQTRGEYYAGDYLKKDGEWKSAEVRGVIEKYIPVQSLGCLIAYHWAVFKAGFWHHGVLAHDLYWWWGVKKGKPLWLLWKQTRIKG